MIILIIIFVLFCLFQLSSLHLSPTLQLFLSQNKKKKNFSSFKKGIRIDIHNIYHILFQCESFSIQCSSKSFLFKWFSWQTCFMLTSFNDSHPVIFLFFYKTFDVFFWNFSFYCNTEYTTSLFEILKKFLKK